MIIIIPIGLIITLIRLCVACCRQKAHERALRREQARLDPERGPLIREEPVQTPQQHYSFVEPTTIPEYTQPPLKDDAYY